MSRYESLASFKEKTVTEISEKYDEKWSIDDLKSAFSALVKKIVRTRVVKGEPRIDGRDTTTVRPINVKVGKMTKLM